MVNLWKTQAPEKSGRLNSTVCVDASDLCGAFWWRRGTVLTSTTELTMLDVLILAATLRRHPGQL